jgi:WD40 repeat protein
MIIESGGKKNPDLEDLHGMHNISRALGVDQIKNTVVENGLSTYQNYFLSGNSKVKNILPGHTGTINDLMLFNDGDDFLVISASADNTIKIWS